MKRALVSWVAFKNDFLISSSGGIEVDPNGPHSDLYRHLNDYDTHFLLSTASEKQGDLRVEYLANYLNRQGKSEVTLVFMNIKDPISVADIKQRVSEFLLSIKDFNIDVYISPGTPAMQTVWYLIAQSFKFKMSLFFVRPPGKRKNPIPQKEYINVEKSDIPETLVLKEQRSIKDDPSIFILDSNQESFKRAEHIANTHSVTALILGETGTGKEVIAKHIHKNSNRSNKPFTAVNCGAFRDELLESRLFGHVKGAFTGANNTTNGLFQNTDGGTLFLDEIGEISEYMQVTLLRVLNKKPCEVIKIGSTKVEKVDVRIIAASNKNLWQMVQKGKFRADLYYRLAIAEIELPPFASYSSSDKRIIIQQIMLSTAKEFGRKPLHLKADLLHVLYLHPFKGNIRELRFLIEQWLTFCTEEVTLDDFKSKTSYSTLPSTSLKLKDIEKTHIERVIKMFPKNKKQIYTALGISYNTFAKKVRDFNLKL